MTNERHLLWLIELRVADTTVKNGVSRLLLVSICRGPLGMMHEGIFYKYDEVSILIVQISRSCQTRLKRLTMTPLPDVIQDCVGIYVKFAQKYNKLVAFLRLEKKNECNKQISKTLRTLLSALFEPEASKR
ncbi:hypothetical protein L1887_09932 [Cichorium endivia]|nr:hypothetical protein L1887_09932 [Cichorium endivia]